MEAASYTLMGRIFQAGMSAEGQLTNVFAYGESLSEPDILREFAQACRAYEANAESRNDCLWWNQQAMMAERRLSGIVAERQRQADEEARTVAREEVAASFDAAMARFLAEPGNANDARSAMNWAFGYAFSAGWRAAENRYRFGLTGSETYSERRAKEEAARKEEADWQDVPF